MSKENLFNEFPPVSTQAWEELIIKDLKGADYNKKLIWKTDEGFSIRPYYRAEDLNDINYLEGLPSEFPFTRGNTLHNHWDIVQEISTDCPVEANAIALEAVKKGANSLVFNAAKINNTTDFSLLLKGINLAGTGIYFSKAASYIELVKVWIQYLKEQNIALQSVRGGIDFDVLTYALKQKRFYNSYQEDMKEMLTLMQLTREMPNFKMVAVNAAALHNAGATTVQELGYGLAMAQQYLALATENGITIDDIASKIRFTFAVGSNYFMEIAKLRAARLLWATIVEAYQPKHEQSAAMFIFSQTSLWNKTVYDPYVNMLRTTTEGMSAALGGANAISLKPYDAAYKTDDEFSRRISRNVQMMLKEESYFDKVTDPAAGSYYIENLTNAIAEHAWALFQQTQKEGVVKLIENATIQTEIETSCQKRDMDIATRKLILLGTNQYPNINETMLDQLSEDKIQCDSPGLKSYRGAMAFEALRLATEKFAVAHGRPKAFLMKIGNLAMRQARAGFATNFFGCAGYEIMDNDGFKTIEEAVKAIQKVQPQIVIICSSDEEYAELGTTAIEAVKTLNSKILFVVAGNPECADALKAVGADDFIHVRTNVLESLKQFNQKLGI